MILHRRWNTNSAKAFYIIVIIIAIIIIFRSPDNGKHIIVKPAKNIVDDPQKQDNLIISDNKKEQVDQEHMAIVTDYIEKRKMLNFDYSTLGKVLFLNENPPPPAKKQFKILVSQIGKMMENRHLYYFGKTRHEPFEFCPVKNCILSYNETDFTDADAVLFLLHRFNKKYNTPTDIIRPPWQRWVFTSDETPHNTFMLQANNWFEYSGIFNWSMMYRLESDVPVPYGRIVPLNQRLDIPDDVNVQKRFELLVPYAKQKRRDVLLAISTSNCGANKRMAYVKELQKFIKVHVFGHCGPKETKELCPFKGYGVQCEELQKYLFYLSFENGNCKGYVTEKLFTHAFKLGSVPVMMGMTQQNYETLAPPNSFIHVEDFKHPRDLAKFILHINETFEENYLKYHEWRRDFQSLSEDGYMGAKSYHYCRLCQALNYNDQTPKVYYKEDLATFLDPDENCRKPVEWKND